MIDKISGAELENSDYKRLNGCFTPTEREYKRGEIITVCSPNETRVGVVKEGVVYLSTDNAEAQRRIIAYFGEGEIFAPCLVPCFENRTYYLTAKTRCKVDFVSYDKFMGICKACCECHKKVIDELLRSTYRRYTVHTDLLCQQSLRSKVMGFFEYISHERGKKSFTLPLPYCDLADYLAIDRSAMMREIKRLNDEGVIKTERRKVTVVRY